MKNAYIFSFLLVAGAGLHAMEPSSFAKASADKKKEELPDWRECENQLAEKYKTILEKSINEKAKINLINLICRGKDFGLSSDKTKEVVKTVCDINGNTFTHLLVISQKYRKLLDFAEKDLISFAKNKEGLSALDIAFTQFFNCIKELDDEIDDEIASNENTKNLGQLYFMLIAYIESEKESKKEGLPDWRVYENKLAERYKILLEKSMDKRDDDTTVDLAGLMKGAGVFALSSDKTKEVIKTVRDKDGNTFAHLLVKSRMNKELIKFVQQDVISFEQNREGLTPLNIAFTQFFNRIKDVDDEKDKTVFCEDTENLRCLYLVLKNYIESKNNPSHLTEITNKYNTCIWCCEKHNPNG